MNILLLHYRYFVTGGPERYLFNVQNLLEENGHRIVPFSVKNNANIPSEFESYFLSPVDGGGEVYFKDIGISLSSLTKMWGRTFYSFEAKRKLTRLLEAYPVEIAYLLQFAKWISPSVLDSLREKGLPVVVRVSDFGYICAEKHCLRNGSVCELCLHGSIANAIRYKCVQDSFILSSITAGSMMMNRYLGMWGKVDAFICPSKFLMRKMSEAGFNSTTLHHIPTFVEVDRYCASYTPGKIIVYFGRISREKGVLTLVDAFRNVKTSYHDTALRLLLIGRPYDDELERINQMISRYQIPDIDIIPEMDIGNLIKIIKDAAFVVVPSICYDNMPNVILESYACGKPVIGSNLGSLPEIIEDGVTGMLFEAGNHEDLAEKILGLITNPTATEKMGKDARRRAETEYTPGTHYERLYGLFNTLVGSSHLGK